MERVLHLQETKGRQVLKQALGNLWPSLSTWGKGKAKSLRIQAAPQKRTEGMLRQYNVSLNLLTSFVFLTHWAKKQKIG